jgi:hypothetical protein
VFGGLEALRRYNPCKHWLFLRSDPLQSRYKGVTGRYKESLKRGSGLSKVAFVHLFHWVRSLSNIAANEDGQCH